MKLLLCLIIAFSFCKTFKCLPIVDNSTETSTNAILIYQVLNAPVRGVSNVNDTDLLLVENDTLPYKPSQNVEVPLHTVKLNNTNAMEMLHMFGNDSDIFEIITNDGERSEAYKSIMKSCYYGFENFLRSGIKAKEKERLNFTITEAFVKVINSSKKNSYVSEVLVLQIVLLFISRFY